MAEDSTSEVPAVRIGASADMPVVGFGTWQLKYQQAYDAVRWALAAGYRHLDTATSYKNEAEVGRAVRDSGLDRGEIFVTTKLPASSAHRVRQTLEESLRDLGQITWTCGSCTGLRADQAGWCGCGRNSSRCAPQGCAM